MKKLILITIVSLLFVSMFLLYGFGAQLKAALLLPGVITDQGWNTLAYNGLKAIEKEYNADISYTERTPVSDYEAIYRQYAKAGFNLIIGHGFEFIDAAKKIAKEFPKTCFLLTSCNVSQAPNLAAVRMNKAQCGFIEGAISAILTKTNKVGIIQGVEFPSSMESENGFKKGVSYINPNVEVLSLYTGSYEDVVKAKEVARVVIEQGADIITPITDAGNVAIVEAAIEKGGVSIIGDIGDITVNCLAPEIVVTSVIQDFSVAFTVVAGDVLKNEFKPQVYRMGLNEGAVYITPFRSYEEKLTNEQKAMIAQIIEDLKSGKINLDDCYVQ